MAPRYETRARSRGEVMETVTPVRRRGSRITGRASIPASTSVSTQYSPQESAPTLPMKVTGLPSWLRPMAQMADALPSVNTTSSTSTSLPGFGKA